MKETPGSYERIEKLLFQQDGLIGENKGDLNLSVTRRGFKHDCTSLAGPRVMGMTPSNKEEFKVLLDVI